MYTLIHFVPPDRKWEAGPNDVWALIGCFGAATLSLTGYAEPDRWDTDDPPRTLFDLDALPLDAALREWQSRPAKAYMFVLDCPDWGKRLAGDLAARIPPDVAGGFLPWDVHLFAGLHTIPDSQGERTIARTRFDLTLSGDQYPPAPERYLSRLMTSPLVAEILAALHTRVAGQWEPLLQLS